ncbi:hypothetical protein E4U14_005151 [Claviceps sp. LM454 group G7]|nr:hypothetical protein E4U14_005151 [Claviceps sp. LM454 group G7]
MATSRMASSVMYDDTEMATERPKPNFKDIVFWVHDKVPSRSFIVGLIEDNGGVISPLAAGARVRIEVQNSLPSRGALPKQKRARTHTCATPPTFTHAEDVALDRFVRSHPARRRAGQPLYKFFAKSNTSHSWQTWRKRWVEVLSLRPEPGQLRITFGQKLATAVPPPNARLESNVSSSASEPQRQSRVSLKSCPRQMRQQKLSWVPTSAAAAHLPSPQPDSNVGSSDPEPPRESSPLSPFSSFSPLSPKSCPRPKGQQKLSWPGPTSTAAAAAATSPAPSLTADRALRESSFAWETPLDLPVSRGSSPAQSEDSSIGAHDDERGQFFCKLFLFAENGADVCVEPSVGGQSIDLWELSQAVAAQQVQNSMVDWLGVAARLHLKPPRDRRLAKELEACYRDNLAVFLQGSASAPKPSRESSPLSPFSSFSPLSPKSCPRPKGQQKLSWPGPTSTAAAAAATSPAPSLTADRALRESSFAWETPLDLPVSRGSSPAQSEDDLRMPIVRLSRVSPDSHK